MTGKVPERGTVPFTTGRPESDTGCDMPTPLNVAVTVPSLAGTSTGSVTDVWHAVDGVRVEVAFPKDEAPLLPVGRAGELAFFRSETRESVSALGKVAYRNEGDDSRSYHFLFGERTRQSLASLLEPRRAHRVHPDPDEPVEVTLAMSGGQKAIIGPARDVSATGIGIDVPWEHEAVLSKRDTVPVRLRLPGRDDELAFVGRIRNRCLGQGAIIYGLEFDLDGVDAKDPRMVELQAYVDNRVAAMAGPRRQSA